MVARRLLSAEQAKLLIDVRERECRLVLVRGRRVDLVGHDEFPAFAEKLRSFFDGTLDVPPSRHDDGCAWQSLGRQWGPDHFLFGRRDGGRCVLKFWNAVAGEQVAQVELAAAEAARWREQLGELLEQAAGATAETEVADEADEVDSRIFAECLRARDFRALSAIAQRHNCIVILSVPDPLARSYIGREGFLPQPPTLVGVTRQSPPNAGLLAADANDPELGRVLERERPGMTLEQYMRSLAACGFLASSEAEGHALRDERGNRYYPAYRLLGVYSAENGRDMWTPASGPLRSEFNARLGLELIPFGPLDQAESADDDGDDERAARPRLPALAFEPGGRVRALLDAAELRAFYESHDINWPYSKRIGTAEAEGE